MADPTPAGAASPDDTLRRQLRFSLYLQSIAAVMMAVAAGFLLFAFGREALTVVPIRVTPLIVGAGACT